MIAARDDLSLFVALYAEDNTEDVRTRAIHQRAYDVACEAYREAAIAAEIDPNENL